MVLKTMFWIGCQKENLVFFSVKRELSTFAQIDAKLNLVRTAGHTPLPHRHHHHNDHICLMRLDDDDEDWLTRVRYTG